MSDSEVAARLREVILALDERHVQPGRTGEARIARDSSDLRARAVARLAELQPEPRDDAGAITATTPADTAPGAAHPFQEVSVTTPVPTRPPPSTSATTDVPADFDPAMTERWHAWRKRGLVEHSRARRRGVLAATGAGVAALTALLLSALLR